jgi:hypothetical protein
MKSLTRSCFFSIRGEVGWANAMCTDMSAEFLYNISNNSAIAEMRFTGLQEGELPVNVCHFWAQSAVSNIFPISSAAAMNILRRNLLHL